MKNLQEILLTHQSESSNIEIDGGLVLEDTLKEAERERKTLTEKCKLLSIITNKKTKVTHDINNVYHAKYEGKLNCFIMSIQMSRRVRPMCIDLETMDLMIMTST